MDEESVSLHSTSDIDNNNGDHVDSVLNTADQLEEAVVLNDGSKLQKLLQSTSNINLALNDRNKSALTLAVKLTKLDIVYILLDSNSCDINNFNINGFSPLDVALITTFDNRLEPRHSICWKIVALLLERGAEPSSRDAMMYVVRTALKYIDDQFVDHLLEIFIQGSVSPTAHELLLTKIHRSQPIYDGNIDHFLIKISQLAVKIIKQTNHDALCQIVNCFVYYIDSYWTSRDLEIKTLHGLIVYVSASGWKWRLQDITLVNRVSENLASWCQNLTLQVPSLQHLCRVKVRTSARKSVLDVTNKISLPTFIKLYLLLNDIDNIMDVRESVNNVQF